MTTITEPSQLVQRKRQTAIVAVLARLTAPASYHLALPVITGWQINDEGLHGQITQDRDGLTEYEAVSRWADHLGARVERIHHRPELPWAEVSCTTVVDGVTVRIWDHEPATAAVLGSEHT